MYLWRYSGDDFLCDVGIQIIFFKVMLSFWSGLAGLEKRLCIFLYFCFLFQNKLDYHLFDNFLFSLCRKQRLAAMNPGERIRNLTCFLSDRNTIHHPQTHRARALHA
ncbi:hypothetical protein CCP2SC5_1200005 [Azospirillaceae bacterium]